MLPRKITSHMEYLELQDSLWSTYVKARDSTDDPILQQVFSETYTKLMHHLEGAYYKCKRGFLLTEEELKSLQQNHDLLNPNLKQD